MQRHDVKLSLIVAMASNRVIGIDNGLPWRLSGDMLFFKQSTMGKPIIMGRKTFDSIGRPLPGRVNIVVTRQRGWRHDGVITVSDIDAAAERARELAAAAGGDECVLIGGASLYEQALPQCERMYITEVQARVDGDAWFPEYDPAEWREVSCAEHPADEKNQYAFTISTLERVSKGCA